MVKPLAFQSKAKTVPKDNLVIAASGYSSVEEIVKISSDRVRAVLIGRALIDHRDPELFLKQIRNAVEKL